MRGGKLTLSLVHSNRKQLSVQTHMSGQLHRQLEEQALQLREAQREVADLHTQLHHFQTALHHRNEGKR